MMVRAGVDDRDMLAATGVPIQLVFVVVFALGAGLAGIAGVVGGTFQSLSPGEDTRFLLASLVVVIVGGMGSIPGAALGAVIIGLAEQLGSVYIPTYAIVVTFLIMVLVLALRPQRQHQHHDEEGHDDRVGRDVDGAELLGEADDDGAQRRARDRSHAADDDDHQGGEQEAGILAGRNRLKGS